MSSGVDWFVWTWMAGAVVVNMLWQGAVVGLVAWVTLVAVRDKSPHTRYGVACTALFMIAFLLPLNALLIKPPEAPGSQVAQAQANTSFLHKEVEADAGRSHESYTPIDFDTSPKVTTVPQETRQAADERPRAIAPSWYDHYYPWIGRAWVLGFLLLVSYDVLGIYAIYRLRRRSQPAGATLMATTASIAERMGVTTRVGVRVVHDIQSACVAGLFRATVLVPASMVTGLPPKALEAILAHELAHIRRWDRSINTFQRAMEAVCFYHPLVWWLARRIDIEREFCCDEEAIVAVPDRMQYTSALLAAATHRREQPVIALSSHGGKLSDRVRHILTIHTVTARPATTPGTLYALGTLTLTLGLVLLSDRLRAEDAGDHLLRLPTGQESATVLARWANPAAHDGNSYSERDYGTSWTVLESSDALVKFPRDTEIKLSVSGADLTGLRDLSPDIIHFLDARYKGLADQDVEPIAHLTGLRALDLSDNRPGLTGAALGLLGPLSALEWLDVQRNELGTLPPHAFTQFPKLRYLAGHFGESGDEVLRQAGRLAELEYLCIKAAHLTPDGLGHLPPNSALRTLILDNAGLSDEALNSLPGMMRLEYLDLRKNPFGDNGLRAIAGFPNLRYLNLSKTNISDVGLTTIAELKELRELVLAHTSITDESLDILAKLPKLQYVDFVGTSISDEHAAAFMATIDPFTLEELPQQQTSNDNAPRVGLVISHFTATGPVRTDYPWGPNYSYFMQKSRDLAQALNEANYDVYAILEPGTQYLGELPDILREAQLTRKIINGLDASALAGLDVIITCRLHNAQVAMLEAIADAIEQGTGMVNIGALGSHLPGPAHPAVERITGLRESVYVYQGCLDSACPIVSAHPIVDGLDHTKMFSIRTLEGIGATSRLPEDAILLLGTPQDYPPLFPVLYERALGRGSIVNAQWDNLWQSGLPLPGFEFYIRAINWAAGSAVDTRW